MAGGRESGAHHDRVARVPTEAEWERRMRAEPAHEIVLLAERGRRMADRRRVPADEVELRRCVARDAIAVRA